MSLNLPYLCRFSAFLRGRELPTAFALHPTDVAIFASGTYRCRNSTDGCQTNVDLAVLYRKCRPPQSDGGNATGADKKTEHSAIVTSDRAEEDIVLQ